jgi:TolB-like protein/class 3 adenylate cyclase
MNRRLAAILAADVVGYSTSMERDEAGTFNRLKTARLEVFEPTIAQHRGRIFKTTGDGFLAEFFSAVDAVECGIKLQRRVNERNRARPIDEHLAIRIGINLGEVIIEGDDRYGEGVNIAARLEQMAAPGALYVSAKVATEVAKRLAGDIGIFEDLGFHQLKNISESVRIFKIQVGDAVVPHQQWSVKKSTVLVLPLINQSQDAQQEYLADGITEDIILELGKFHELAVIARSASFAFKGKHKRAQDISHELGANYVVEGSVRKAGTSIRVSVQLWNTSTAAQLWAERYDRAFEEILAVQDEVTRKIVSSVMGRVFQADYHRTLPLSPDQLAAYDCWLRGHHVLMNWTPEGDREALIWLERAIEKDPNFARAHASIATLLTGRTLLTPGYGGEKEDRARALKHARLAVDHDPDDARCHLALGWIYIWLADLSRAKRHLKLAINLNPNAADNLMSCAFGLAYGNELPQARALATHALELNSLHADWYYYFLSQMSFMEGDYERSYELGHPYIEHFPESGGWTAAALALAGRQSEAIEEGRRFIKIVEGRWAGERPMRKEDAVRWFWWVNHFLPESFKATLKHGLELAQVVADGEPHSAQKQD